MLLNRAEERNSEGKDSPEIGHVKSREEMLVVSKVIPGRRRALAASKRKIHSPWNKSGSGREV